MSFFHLRLFKTPGPPISALVAARIPAPVTCQLRGRGRENDSIFHLVGVVKREVVNSEEKGRFWHLWEHLEAIGDDERR